MKRTKKMNRRFSWLLLFGAVFLVGILASGEKAFLAEREPEEKMVGMMGKELEKLVVDITTFKGLSPMQIISSKGTTVIWLNHSSINIRIAFEGGDQVTLSCINPQNFILQKNGTFQSDIIPRGGTASLCFVEPGEYKYHVIQVSGSERRDPETVSEYAKEGVVRIQ